MIGKVRAFIRVHFEQQQHAIAELRGLRADLAALAANVARLEAFALAPKPQAAAPATPSVPSSATDLERDLAWIAGQDGRHADPLSLTRHHAQVYSQNGEDGMIAEILRRIGARTRTFLEVGIEAGMQNNTRLLLEQGWRGVWIEGNPAHAHAAAERFAGPIAEGRLVVVSEMVTPDGINQLLDASGLPQELDVLSLDIDQHTTHVWRALQRRSRVACIEYNASVPPALPVEVPYVATDAWDGTNWFGGGLKALELIGAAKGLHLVGCDIHGVNAFFVEATETAGRFRAPFTAETHYQPANISMVMHIGHQASPAARRWQIAAEAASGAGLGLP